MYAGIERVKPLFAVFSMQHSKVLWAQLAPL